jgi:hypothetical protein
MAPLPEPRKRASLDAEDPKPTQQKRPYHRNHCSHWKQTSELPFVDHDTKVADHQLRRAIAIILSTVGFEDAQPEALESFKFAVQECKSFHVWNSFTYFFFFFKIWIIF